MNTAIRTLETMIIALVMIGIIGTATVGVAMATTGNTVGDRTYDSSVFLDNKDASNNYNLTPDDGIGATVLYNATGDTFDWQVTGNASLPYTEYSLIYYADKVNRFANWGGDNPGVLIGTMYSQGQGILMGPGSTVSCQCALGCCGSTELNMGLPCEPDWNINPVPDYCDYHNGFDNYEHCAGAKLWLVPSADYDASNHEVMHWGNVSYFLMETDLITYTDTGASTKINIGDITPCEYDFRNVTLPVIVSNAYNIGSMQITVSYNDSLINVVNVTNGAMDNMDYLIDDGRVVINTHQEGSAGMTGMFDLVDITFEPIANGECDLVIDPTGYDATYVTTPIDLEAFNGEYNTREFMLGDVNSNGATDVGDVMVLAKYLIGMDEFTVIDECASDVDHNCEIDVADVSYLARALLGDTEYPLTAAVCKPDTE